MRQAVRDAFVGFTATFEGVVSWMYLDVKGLVTTAIGNLIDPLQYALPLPWIRPDGTPATHEEIAAEWTLVKGHPTAAREGHRVLRGVTNLRLTDDGIRRVVERKFSQNWAHLRSRFAEIETWPADAQLATLSMAWALGPAFGYPMLCAALHARKFDLAAAECGISERGNPGVAPRNVANRVLFRNAAVVLADGLDPDALYYPTDLARSPVAPDADTEPELPPPSSRRPPRISDFATVHPRVPLGRPALDDEEPDPAA